MISLELNLVSSALNGIVGLGLAFFNGSLASFGSIIGSLLASLYCVVGSLLASLNSVVHSTLCSIYCVIYCTFHSLLSAFDSFFGSVLSCIGSIGGQSLNLFDDRGQRSNVDVEALQGLCILLYECLNLLCILGNLGCIGTFHEFRELGLNRLESSLNGCCVTRLNLLCQGSHHFVCTCLGEIKTFLNLACASTETHCSCYSYHCK